jgi:outer membrane protein, adhesin transport system
MAVLGASVFASMPVAHGETLTEAVEHALLRFPDFRAALANRRAVGEQIEQARGALYPQIDLALGRGRETNENTFTRPLGFNPTLSRQEASLSASQLLFDGGVVSGQVRRFAQRADSASFQIANAADTVALRVALAYLEVMRLRGQVSFAEENAAVHDRTARQVDLLAERGAGRRSDAQQALARLAFANSLLTQQRGQLAQAESAYRHLVGHAPGAMRKPDTGPQLLPADIDAALEQLLVSHPAVLAAERELSAAQADRDSARARLAPRVDLEVGGTKNRDIDGVRGPNEDRFVMLRLRSNLYRGGADEARVREAQARIEEASAGLSRARNDVERDLRLAWEGLVASRERIAQLEQHAGVSAQVVQAYRAQFSIGQRSLLDVLNAENELYTARGNALNGLLGVSADEIRVLSAMGRLMSTLGISLPEEAKVDDGAR